MPVIGKMLTHRPIRVLNAKLKARTKIGGHGDRNRRLPRAIQERIDQDDNRFGKTWRESEPENKSGLDGDARKGFRSTLAPTREKKALHEMVSDNEKRGSW